MGAIYFHRITDTRERKKDFKLFSQVLTAIPAENTALITTMPYMDEVKNIEQEQELAALWNEATTRGASIGRFSNTSESAWNIIAQLVVPERLEPSPIREENLVQFIYMMLAKNEEEAGLLKSLKKTAKTDKDGDLVKQYAKDSKGLSSQRDDLEKLLRSLEGRHAPRLPFLFRR